MNDFNYLMRVFMRHKKFMFLLFLFSLFPISPLLSQDCCESIIDKPDKLTFVYTGGGCSFNSTNSPDGKHECINGTPVSGPQVISVLDDGELIGGSTTINEGDVVEIYVKKGGGNDFGNELQVKIGPQIVEIHTSCSDGLVSGANYGALQLTSVLGDDGSTCGLPANPCTATFTNEGSQVGILWQYFGNNQWNNSPVTIQPGATFTQAVGDGQVWEIWNQADDVMFAQFVIDCDGNTDYCFTPSGGVTCTEPEECPTPVINVSTQDICPGDLIMFTAEDLGFPCLEYTWDFGSNATPSTATGLGPISVVFSDDNASTADVSLSIDNDCENTTPPNPPEVYGCCNQDERGVHDHPHKLILEYVGSGSPNVIFTDGGSFTFFSGQVSNGDIFVVDGTGHTDKHGESNRLETNTDFKIGNGSWKDFHTSCSQDISPGFGIQSNGDLVQNGTSSNSVFIVRGVVQLNMGSATSIFCEEGITDPNGGGGDPANGTTVCGSDCFDCEETTTLSIPLLVPPSANVTTQDSGCDDNNGSITFTFNDNPTRTNIEFSLDGGDTYPLNVLDNSGTASFNNLSAGSYDLFVRWGNDECPVDLGTVILESICIDLELTKTASVSQASNGDQVTYTLTLENKGPNDATGVSVRVEPPAGVQYVSDNPSMGSYNSFNNIWTVGTVLNGESKTLELIVDVISIDSPITCFAQVETANEEDIDSTPGNDNNQTPDEDDEDDVTIEPNLIDLELTKTASVSQAANGDQVTYTLTLENKGPGDATGVTVKVEPPIGVQYVSDNPSMGFFNIFTNTWVIGNVLNGESKTLELTVDVISIDSPLTCFAQVETANEEDIDSTPGNDNNQTPDEDDEDDATITPFVPDVIDLELTKTASISQASNGDQVTYTLTLLNKGPDDATGVSVKIEPPIGVQYVSDNPSMGSYNSFNNIWTVGTVLDGESKTLELTVDVISINSPITCFAQVETANEDDIDSTPGNDNNQTPNEDDEDDVTISPIAPEVIDLELTKTASVSQAANGDQVTYTLTLLNKGPDDATGVSVKIEPPIGIQYVNDNPSMGSYNSFSNIWTVGTVLDGESKTLELTVDVINIDSPITCFAQVETANEEDIDSTPGNDNNQTPNEDDEDDVTITPLPVGDEIDLELTKTVDNPILVKFTSRTFTISVTNKGPATATGVVVSDQIPTGLAFTGVSATQGSYNVFTQRWDVGTLAPNQTETLDLTLFILNVEVPITNFAQVDAANETDIDSTPGNDTDNTPDEDDEDDATITPEGFQDIIDLELTKTASVSQASNGDQVTYTLTLENRGPSDATGVSVKVEPPAGVQYVSDNPSMGSYNSFNNTWTVGTVLNGESKTLDLTVNVVSIDSPITCFAQVETANEDDVDSTPGNDNNQTPDEDDEDDVTITPIAPNPIDLELTKTASVSQASNGDQVTYTITLLNKGPADATGVSVKIDPPAGVQYVSDNPSMGFYNSSSNIWTVGTVLAGESKTLDLTVNVISIDSPITCFAQVQTTNENDVDSTPGNDNNQTPNEDDEDDVTIIPISTGDEIDLELTKTVDNTELVKYKHRTFTITVTNKGPATATGVTVEDQIPGGQAFSGSSASKGSYTPWSGIWTIGTLAPNESASLDITIFILNDSAPIVNFAQVETANEPDIDSTPGNDTDNTPNEDDEDDATIGGGTGPDQIDLELTKNVNVIEAVVGDYLTYSLYLVNKGPANATGVSVKDQLPSELSFVSSSASVGSYNSNTGIWTVGNLNKNASATLTIVAEVLIIDDIVTNFAQVQTANEPDIDSTPGNDSNNVPNEDDEDEASVLPSVPCDNVTEAGAIGYSETGCGPVFDAADIVNLTFPSGGTGALEYLWFKSYTGTPFVPTNPDWIVIPNSNTPGLAIGTVTQTTYYIRCARRFGCTDYPGESNIVVKTVESCQGCDNVTSGGTIGYNETGCAPSFDPANMVSLSSPTGGTGAIEYLWFKSNINTPFVQGSTDWYPIANSNSATYNPGPISQMTYYIRCSRRAGCEDYIGESNTITKTVETCNNGDEIDLEVNVEVNTPVIGLYQQVTFSITVTNNSNNTATGVEIDNPIPHGMAFTNKYVSQGNYNLWTQVWNVGTIVGGTSATMDLVLFTLNLDNPVVNFAQVSAANETDSDSTPNNNSTTTPMEDDEDAATVSLAGSSGGKGVSANQIIDQSTTLVLQSMFPVPTTDQLTILFHTKGFQFNVMLYDVNGKLLSRESVRTTQGDNVFQLEVGHLPAGFYAVSIETPEGKVRGKFVKQ